MTQQEFLAIAKRISGLPDSAAPRAASLLDEGRRAMWFGNLIIFAGLGLFLVWALIAPLGEGVPAQGRVVVESMRRAVSHSTGGSIETIHVKENQRVAAGDTLITLKTDKARSAYDTMVQEYLTAAAKLARLRAEQENAPSVEFSEELYNLAEQHGRLPTLKAQQDLFATRRSALANEQAILRENLTASQAQVAGLQKQAEAKQTQANLLQKELESMRPLVEPGYTSRNAVLDLERRVAEALAARTELETRVAREHSQIAELRLRLLQSRQNFLREVETQLAEARSDALKYQGLLSDAKVDLEGKRIVAPVAGQVVALQANAPGSAINPGAKILEIVPANEGLLIDVQVPVQYISSVKAGQHADIRITSFAGQAQLVVDGEVVSVSSDVHEAQPPQLPYYLARVAVTPEGVQGLQGNELRPGMAVDVVIKTGERSLVAYLIRPIMKQIFYALKEQ